MTQIEKYIQHLDIQQLTDLQYDTIEHAFDKANQLILSATGSGKTLAFLLPLALKIEDKKEEIQALIIVPTRELALQIEDVFKKLRTNHKVLTCYGGHSFKTEQKSFSNLPTVLIGTPGRICDHMLRSGLDISTVKHLVIDEYDKCLEFGFEDQMKFILDDVRLNSTTLSSATPLQKTPSIISFEDPLVFDYLDEASAPDLTYFEIKTSENKMQFIADLVCTFQGELTIIFCNLRESAEELQSFLNDQDIAAIAYHGGLEQAERESALLQFRNGSFHTLICTDLGARGLDIPLIKHIIHAELPPKEAVFIHRNGRTARMEQTGDVYYFKEKSSFDIPVDAIKYTLPKAIPTPVQPAWKTIYFSAGKKNKINKIDLVGFICQKGGLDKTDIGLITVQDYSSFVAIKMDQYKTLIKTLSQHKIKGQKLKIAVAKTNNNY